MPRIVSWFSCGAASAVATKMAADKYGDITIVYCDTGSEHPDNQRFLKDCEKWFGQEIIVLKSEKYKDTWDVFRKTRYLAGVKGSRCRPCICLVIKIIIASVASKVRRVAVSLCLSIWFIIGV